MPISDISKMLKPKLGGTIFPDDYRAEITEAVREFAQDYRELQTAPAAQRKPSCRTDTGRDELFMSLYALPAIKSSKSRMSWCYEFAQYRDGGGTFEEIHLEFGDTLPHQLTPVMAHDDPVALARLGTYYGLTREEQLAGRGAIINGTSALPYLHSCGLIQWDGPQEEDGNNDLAIAPPKSLREFRQFLYCFYGHLGVVPADEYMDWVTLNFFGAATESKPDRPSRGTGFRVNGDHGNTPGLHEAPTPLLILSDSPLPEAQLKAFLESELSFVCPYPVSELKNSPKGVDADDS